MSKISVVLIALAGVAWLVVGLWAYGAFDAFLYPKPAMAFRADCGALAQVAYQTCMTDRTETPYPMDAACRVKAESMRQECERR